MILPYRHHLQVVHEAYRFRAKVEGAFPAIIRRPGPFPRARNAVMQRREAGGRMIARNVDLRARSRAAQGALRIMGPRCDRRNLVIAGRDDATGVDARFRSWRSTT